MKYEIREPSTEKEWHAYYKMRYDILRKPLNKPIGSERNDGDIKGKHFALYENNDLRAIARLDQNQNNISQVRFVAVDTKYQKKGFGKLIIKAAENESQKNGNKKMILHSRDYSLDFYKKIGYKKIKKSYKLFNVIQHYLMEKTY